MLGAARTSLRVFALGWLLLPCSPRLLPVVPARFEEPFPGTVLNPTTDPTFLGPLLSIPNVPINHEGGM
jgi:hypothetical protein